MKMSSLKTTNPTKNRKEIKGEGLLRDGTKIDLIIKDDRIEPEAEKLIKIVFEKAQITKLKEDAFVRFTDLTELILTENNIENLDEKIFDNLISLKHINLSGNKIAQLDSAFFINKPNLESINFSSNRIAQLDSNIFRELNNSERLVTLNFSSNQITELNPDTFENLKNLLAIDFSNNCIKELDANIFKQLTKAEKIDFSFNLIEFLNLKMFEGLHNLNEINFSDNKISSINENFPKCLSLKTLVFSNNQIEELNVGVFKSLNNLETIDFSHNRLIQIDPTIFAGLNSLKYVNFECSYESSDRFFSYDHYTLIDEFFKKNTNLNENQKYKFRYDAYIRYYIMYLLSKKPFQSQDDEFYTVLNTNETGLNSKEQLENLGKKFLRLYFLDFLLRLEKISNKTIVRLLESVSDIQFGLDSMLSVSWLCKRDGPNIEELMDKLKDNFFIPNFNFCFDSAIRNQKETIAIGLFKIFWSKVKSDLRNNYSIENFAHVQKKHSFFINPYMSKLSQLKWWRFFEEVLNIYGKEKEKGDLAMLFFMAFDCKFISNQVKNRDLNTIESQSNIETEPIENPQHHLIPLITESKQPKLINHPSTRELLEIKWRKWPRAIWVFSIVLYFLFVVFYTLSLEGLKISKNSTLYNVCWIASLVLTSIFLIIEYVQLLIFHIHYLTSSLVVIKLINAPLCLINLLVSNMVSRSILYSITIILTYMIFILHLEFLEKISKNVNVRIGIYVNVFKSILAKSIGALPLTILTVIAFVLAFRATSNNNSGDHLYDGAFLYASIRTMSVSLGEYNSDEMGIGKEFNGSTFINYFVYGSFMFILPLAIINMFVGISVDQIIKRLNDANGQNVKLRSDYVVQIQQTHVALFNLAEQVVKSNSVKSFYLKGFCTNSDDLSSGQSIGNKITSHIKFTGLLASIYIIAVPVSIISTVKKFVEKLKKNSVAPEKKKDTKNNDQNQNDPNLKNLDNKLKEIDQDIERLSMQQKGNFNKKKDHPIPILTAEPPPPYDSNIEQRVEQLNLQLKEDIVQKIRLDLDKRSNIEELNSTLDNKVNDIKDLMERSFNTMFENLNLILEKNKQEEKSSSSSFSSSSSEVIALENQVIQKVDIEIQTEEQPTVDKISSEEEKTLPEVDDSEKVQKKKKKIKKRIVKRRKEIVEQPKKSSPGNCYYKTWKLMSKNNASIANQQGELKETEDYRSRENIFSPDE